MEIRAKAANGKEICITTNFKKERRKKGRFAGFVHKQEKKNYMKENTEIGAHQYKRIAHIGFFS